MFCRKTFTDTIFGQITFCQQSFLSKTTWLTPYLASKTLGQHNILLKNQLAAIVIHQEQFGQQNNVLKII
jgi:hypothetical protein